MITVEMTIDASEVLAGIEFDEGMLQSAYAGLYEAGEKVMDTISLYPPVSEANQPGPYPKKWYQRGVGPFWALKGGGFHFRQSSQQLNKRWAIEQQDNGATVVIGNNASYAPMVHSKELQPAFHAARGWRTAEAVMEESRQMVVDTVAEFVVNELNQRNK